MYREEYLDKDGSKREETNFSFPGARVFHRSEDKQILKLDFPTSATSSPYVGKQKMDTRVAWFLEENNGTLVMLCQIVLGTQFQNFKISKFQKIVKAKI